ncbi:MAG: hypothetical protein MUC69_04085 [Gemmatimonadales bacterium]|nr:hypothetical protein [Gemmatimonadales bacterium]
MSRRLVGRALGLAAGVALLAGAGQALQDPFDHWQHRTLFLSCSTCHVGAKGSGPLWPAAADCTSCHDGKVEKQVAWTPRTEPPVSNLRFAHDVHVRAFTGEKRISSDSATTCAQCHAEKGAAWMQVKRALVGNCIDCHQPGASHYDADPEQCATCHLPLTEARRLPESRIAAWKAPSSHDDPAFQSKHGELAGPVTVKGREMTVSPACATCHARDYCITCHVNAPEEPTIQALGLDARSLAIAAPTLEVPATHKPVGFMTTHGRGLDKAGAKQCSVCHTAESCQSCHLVPPAKVRLLPASGPGRAKGASLERKRPANHGRDFTDGHGSLADGAPQNCAGCHTLEQCIDCHRPNQAAEANYHPSDFLSRHPVAAYSNETTCADCHNPGQFCQSCHIQAGLRSNGRLGSKGNYHDVIPTWGAAHGTAARQNLEACVSCHSERDCLACHSAVGGRRFNPHGPGFNAERLRQSNPQMCTACHGFAIPGGS